MSVAAGALSLDDPRTTVARRDLLLAKPLLKQIYEEWYRSIAEALPAGAGPVLEIGSGPGFLRERIPGLVSSEVFLVPGVHAALDAGRLPLADGSLRAIVMTDVFHHLPDARAFLAGAVRALRPGGVVAMVEPWPSRWSRFVYGNVHHEPFDAAHREWELPPGGPLSVANGALPWIVFSRDRERCEREFPALRVASIRPGLPLRYLASGGFSMPQLLPGFVVPALTRLEAFLDRWPATWAMFARVVLVKEPPTARS